MLVVVVGDNCFLGEFSVMYKEQQCDGGGGQMFKEGDESVMGWEE